jgi:hypothetical protein
MYKKREKDQLTPNWNSKVTGMVELYLQHLKNMQKVLHCLTYCRVHSGGKEHIAAYEGLEH